MQYILLAILIFIAYRFITGFIIPVVRTTSQVRKQFQHMKSQMNKAQEQHQPSQQNGKANGADNSTQKPKFDVEGEYISFEDVK